MKAIFQGILKLCDLFHVVTVINVKCSHAYIPRKKKKSQQYFFVLAK